MATITAYDKSCFKFRDSEIVEAFSTLMFILYFCGIY